MNRKMLKEMRIKNPRTNGEHMANAQIDAILMEPWRRLFWVALALAAVIALVVIALKL